MAQVKVQTLRESNQSHPLLQATIDLMDRVQSRAFELFEARGGSHGDDVGDWLRAEKEVFRVPDIELVES